MGISEFDGFFCRGWTFFFSSSSPDVFSTIGFISMIGKLFGDCGSLIRLRVLFSFLSVYLGDKVSFFRRGLFCSFKDFEWFFESKSTFFC